MIIEGNGNVPCVPPQPSLPSRPIAARGGNNNMKCGSEIRGVPRMPTETGVITKWLVGSCPPDAGPGNVD